MMDKRGAAHHRSRFLFFPQIILMPQTSSRSAWTSRLGFILASAGSAVGLGAIWKFPYMAGTNGGSIFMLPTIAFSLTIGLALLIAEMSMGRAARGGAGTAYLKLGGRAWSVIGFISVATGALVLAFYSVVGGWCTHYFIESIMGRGITDDPAAMRSAFEAFAADPVQSVMGHVIFLTTTAGVVLCGVERGIERVGKILMPLLFILMLILIVRGLMLPGAIEGVKFLFMPDPEAFTGEALLNAMGFAFFSLSVGSGSMMNYGSYLSDKVNVGTSTAWIVVLAVMSSILGGLMIMPAVFAFGLTPDAVCHYACRLQSPADGRTFRRGVLRLPFCGSTHIGHFHSGNGFAALRRPLGIFAAHRRAHRFDGARHHRRLLRALLRAAFRLEALWAHAF